MNSAEFRKWLASKGCRFEPHALARESGIGSVTVRLGSRRSILPLLGSKKRLPPEVMRKIKEDLGIAEPGPSPGL
jgi:mRNA interferase HicA